MKKMLKRLCTGFLALATVVTALPTTPVHAESKQYWTESKERVGIVEKVMNDGSIGSTFNEGHLTVEGEDAYCIDINTDFKNGYKTRADASTRMSADQISDVALSIEYVKQYTDYPFFMVAFLQIVCFAGIYMKLGDLMSMFSLNAGDSQNMGRRIFRRPYLFMRHRARRMEHRIARAVSAGGISGGVAGAVAGSAVAGKRAERKNTASKENRGNTTSSMGQRAGSKVGAVLDTKNKVKDKANAVKENIKDMPTQTAYAVYSAKEKAKSSVSDFKRGMVQEQQSRQTGRLEKQEQHRQNIADKRMELQKAQEARQRKTDGSATTGATRPHERPATASTIPKPSAEKMQEVKRPATATTSKASEPVKTNVVKERPLSSGASDKKATQPAQPVHRQNVEKVVSQETRQNYKAERTTKKQTFEQSKRTTEHTEKNRNLVTKKGQKKK